VVRTYCFARLKKFVAREVLPNINHDAPSSEVLTSNVAPVLNFSSLLPRHICQDEGKSAASDGSALFAESSNSFKACALGFITSDPFIQTTLPCTQEVLA
jgi:hypothetical protein